MKSVKKTKEEQIKFIIRKAFKFIFLEIKKKIKSNLNLQDIHSVCMKHYFSKEDSEFILPFK